MVKGHYKMEKFVLQLQIDRISKQLDSGGINQESAVNELHSYFEKYPKGFHSDLIQIFKSW